MDMSALLNLNLLRVFGGELVRGICDLVPRRDAARPREDVVRFLGHSEAAVRWMYIEKSIFQSLFSSPVVGVPSAAPLRVIHRDVYDVDVACRCLARIDK